MEDSPILSILLFDVGGTNTQINSSNSSTKRAIYNLYITYQCYLLIININLCVTQ